MDKPSILFDKSLIFHYIPIFSGLNLFERKLVADSLEIVEFKQSQMIYAQDSPPDAFYCILTGRVEIFTHKGQKEETLEYIHRGKYFGFISLLTAEPHSVNARAFTDTVVAKISKEDFNVILKSIPRLAIDLSRMLSRRLKRKDFHPKAVFESTIISVYAYDSLLKDSSYYCLNLALGLGRETQKKVIVIDAETRESVMADVLGLGSSCAYVAPTHFMHPEDALKKIVHTDKGFDLLRVLPNPQKKLDAASLIPMVTMLVNDYHYCIVHLSSSFGPEVFKVLAQSDAVHLLVAGDIRALKEMSKGLEESGVWTDAELKKKMKLLVLEEGQTHGKGAKLTVEQEAALFHQPIYATLPQPNKTGYCLVDKEEKGPYAKTIRRISRETGEVLVGLALGSGSAMGLAHVGVLKVLEKEDIPIDIVSGSSIGALIGALWCSGYSALEVEEIIMKNKNKKYLFGLDDFAFPLHGLIKGEHIHRFLKKYLRDKTFFDVKRSFKVVACDCMGMRQVVFDSGRLVDAVMASISIPGVFKPYRIADNYYMDGGILNPLPTDLLVEAGVRKIISVNVLPSSEDIEHTYELLMKKEKNAFLGWPRFLKPIVAGKRRLASFFRPNIFDVIVSSVQSMEFLLARMSSVSQSDVTLHPDMTGISWADFQNIPDLVQRGEEETRLHLREIKELLSQID